MTTNPPVVRLTMAPTSHLPQSGDGAKTSANHTQQSSDITADMTAQQKRRSCSYRPHQRRVTQQRVCVIWVSAASGPDCCGQCGRAESRGQAQPAFRGRRERGRVQEQKGRSKVNFTHSFWEGWRGHSHDLAEEVKPSQVDMSVSTSLCCAVAVCEDSGENAALRWGKEGILPRHSMAMSPEDFPLRVRLDNTYGCVCVCVRVWESPGMTLCLI